MNCSAPPSEPEQAVPLISLRRHINALEEENAELKGWHSKWWNFTCQSQTNIRWPSDPSYHDVYHIAGRAIHRVVSLTDCVEDLIGEYNWRAISEDNLDAGTDRCVCIHITCLMVHYLLAARITLFIHTSNSFIGSLRSTGSSMIKTIPMSLVWFMHV